MAFVITIEDGDRNTLVDLYTTHDAYLLPDGSEMFIRSEAAWCRSCACFTLVERLQQPEEMESRAREYARDRLEHPTLTSKFYTKEKQTELVMEGLTRALHQARQWQLALLNREYGPRCLECEGAEFILLPDRNEWLSDPSIPYPRVRKRPQISHASMGYRGRLFDTEGRRIDGRYASH